MLFFFFFFFFIIGNGENLRRIYELVWQAAGEGEEREREGREREREKCVCERNGRGRTSKSTSKNARSLLSNASFSLRPSLKYSSFFSPSFFSLRTSTCLSLSHALFYSIFSPPPPPTHTPTRAHTHSLLSLIHSLLFFSSSMKLFRATFSKTGFTASFIMLTWSLSITLPLALLWTRDLKWETRKRYIERGREKERKKERESERERERERESVCVCVCMYACECAKACFSHFVYFFSASYLHTCSTTLLLVLLHFAGNSCLMQRGRSNSLIAELCANEFQYYHPQLKWWERTKNGSGLKIIHN